MTVAAATGTEPADVATALVRVIPDHGICVVAADATECAGSGTLPSDLVLADLERTRSSEDGDVGSVARVTANERRVTIDARGPSVTVVVQVPIDDAAGLWPTTYLPAGALGAEYFGDGNTRQTAVAVPGAIGVYMVATAEQDAPLPAAEYRFYLVVFSLAVVLLVLAGITLIVEHRSLVERASFDPLTKLPNRSEFERCADDALTHGAAAGACLLLFDLDGFKEVNDTHGHHAGDEVLRVVAQRLRRSVRDGDIVARWGGDEFVVLMPGVTSAEMGTRRAQQLADEVAGRTRVNGVPDVIRVKTSVGVSLWPVHGDDLDMLIESADRAMYEAKRAGVTSRVAPFPPFPFPMMPHRHRS